MHLTEVVWARGARVRQPSARHLRDPDRYDDRIRKLDAVAEMPYGLNVDSRTILAAP